MFSFIQNLFRRKKIKNFGITLEPATEGTNSKKELSPEVMSIIKRLHRNDVISNDEMNKITAHFFDLKPIEAGTYNLNKAIIERMCFEISGVHTVYNTRKDIENMYINLREVTFENDFVITVSVKDFHEIFNLLNFQPVESKD